MGKHLIKVHPMYPNSHRMQDEININVDYIISVGVNKMDGNAIIGTPTFVMITKESYEEVMRMIDGKVIDW